MLRLFIQRLVNKDRENVSKQEKKEEMNMSNVANFTMKETNLLFQTIIEKDLGITLADNMADLRSKTDIFANDSKITVEQFNNKQDTTRVRIFRTEYVDDYGKVKVAYTHTL